MDPLYTNQFLAKWIPSITKNGKKKKTANRVYKKLKNTFFSSQFIGINLYKKKPHYINNLGFIQSDLFYNKKIDVDQTIFKSMAKKIDKILDQKKVTFKELLYDKDIDNTIDKKKVITELLYDKEEILVDQEMLLQMAKEIDNTFDKEEMKENG